LVPVEGQDAKSSLRRDNFVPHFQKFFDLSGVKDPERTK